MIKVISDVIDDIVLAVEKAFPQVDAELYWYYPKEGEDAKGKAILDDNVILVSFEVPIGKLPDIIAHEAAHLVEPDDIEHGEAFDTAYDKIFDEYVKMFGASEE